MVRRSRLSRSVMKHREKRMLPFSTGKDVRGDFAVFIPRGTEEDNPVLVSKLKELKPQMAFNLASRKFEKKRNFFFRLIDSKGNQLHTHGWIRYNPKTKMAEVTQYG